MNKPCIAEIMQLDVSERIELVQDIWDSVAAVPEAVPLTDAQRQELERRLAEYRRNPDSGSPWDEVKRRITRP